jgi:hypothetical protein
MSVECSARDIDLSRVGQTVSVDLKGGCSPSRLPHLARLGYASIVSSGRHHPWRPCTSLAARRPPASVEIVTGSGLLRKALLNLSSDLRKASSANLRSVMSRRDDRLSAWGSTKISLDSRNGPSIEGASNVSEIRSPCEGETPRVDPTPLFFSFSSRTCICRVFSRLVPDRQRRNHARSSRRVRGLRKKGIVPRP